MPYFDIPVSLKIAFGILTLYCFIVFFWAIKKGENSKINFKIAFGILSVWVLTQGTLSYIGFFQNDLDKYPPRLMYLLLPNLIMTVYVFFSTKGQRFVDRLHIPTLVMLSFVRVPVEVVLLKLYQNDAIPQLMTFEGRNFDIVAGISVFLVYYLCYIKKSAGKVLLLVWNTGSTLLLMFIIFNAVFSVPSPTQLFAFQHPNFGLLIFPFTWLAAFVAPIVLFSHFVIFRRYVILKKEFST